VRAYPNPRPGTHVEVATKLVVWVKQTTRPV
jgi:hypothetical protein